MRCPSRKWHYVSVADPALEWEGGKDYFDSNVTVATFTLFNIENEASMGIEIFERKVYRFSVICNSPVLEIISV